jgi:hypothetical protein
MAATNYTYSIVTDTANGAVHPKSLDIEVRASTIVIALEGITTGGDVLTVTMKDALSTGDETELGNLVAAHTGVVSQNMPAPSTAHGVPLVQTTWREGTATDFITFNWCNKSTWYTDSVRVTDEALTDSGDGLTWNSANVDWICVTHGHIPQEHRLADDYGHIIKVDSVEMTEHSRDAIELFDVSADPADLDGDFMIDHQTGDVTFKVSQTGKTVEATYSHAQGSSFFVTPDEGKTLRLTAVEVQFSDDVVLTDSVRFDIEGYIHAFVPGVTVDDVSPNYTTSFPTGFRVPLGSPRIYKTMMDFIAEAQRAYPIIPVLGGSGWRGLPSPVYVMRWPYQEDATRDLVADMGMRIKISLSNNVPYGGSVAVATLYAVSTDS